MGSIWPSKITILMQSTDSIGLQLNVVAMTKGLVTVAKLP